MRSALQGKKDPPCASPEILATISKENTIAELLSPFQRAMQKVGITRELLAQRLSEELVATETKFFAHQGLVTEARVVVDWGTRQRARMDAHKLLGDYAPEVHNLNVTGSRNYSPEEETILRETADALARKSIEARQAQLCLDSEQSGAPNGEPNSDGYSETNKRSISDPQYVDSESGYIEE